MEQLLGFLNKNAGALMVAFTAIVTLSTIVYALLTGLLVKETRKMRHAQTEPKVDVTYKTRDEWINLIDIVVRNIGLGPAYNIKFEIIHSSSDVSEDLVNDLKKINFMNKGLNYLSPGQEIRSLFTEMTKDFENKIISQFTIKAYYENSAGKKYSDKYLLDFSELKGMRRIGEPPMHTIAKSLEAIKKDVAYFASGWKRLRTDIYTAEDRRKEKEAIDDYIENMKKEKQKPEADIEP